MATAHLIKLEIGFLLVTVNEGEHRVRQVRAGYRVGETLERLGLPRSTPVLKETPEWLEALLNSTLTQGQSSRSTSASSRSSRAKASS